MKIFYGALLVLGTAIIAQAAGEFSFQSVLRKYQSLLKVETFKRTTEEMIDHY